MRHDEIFYIYFNDSRNTMGIGTFMGLIAPEYPVGQELLNFIDLDLKEYEERRILLEDFFTAQKKTNQTKEIDIKVMNLYREMPIFQKRERKANSISDLKENGEIGEFLLNTTKEIKDHPYCRFCISERRDVFKEYGLDLFFYQNHFKELIEFCFDQTYNLILNQLTAEERYFLWKKRNTNPMFAVDQSEINCRTNISHIAPQDFYKKDLSNLYDNEINQDTIDLIKSANVFPLQLFYCNTPVEYAFCEFNALIKINAKMKRCKRCGKYFILKGDYNTDYCDRIFPNEKLSCKKAAAVEARKNKVQKSPILKEYERAYKRNYARINNGKITKEEFRIWTEEATKERDKVAKLYEANPSDQIIESFKKYLGNK